MKRSNLAKATPGMSTTSPVYQAAGGRRRGTWSILCACLFAAFSSTLTPASGAAWGECAPDSCPLTRTILSNPAAALPVFQGRWASLFAHSNAIYLLRSFNEQSPSFGCGDTRMDKPSPGLQQLCVS